MDRPDARTFRTSRVRSFAGMIGCGLLALILGAMGPEGRLLDTLAGGGLAGRMAFATLIFSALSIFCLVALVYRPRAVIVDRSGVTIRSIAKEIALPWSAIDGVEKGGAFLRRGVVLETQDGPLLIGDGMGNTRRMMSTIREGKAASGAPERRARRKGRGSGPMFGVQPV